MRGDDNDGGNNDAIDERDDTDNVVVDDSLCGTHVNLSLWGSNKCLFIWSSRPSVLSFPRPDFVSCSTHNQKHAYLESLAGTHFDLLLG
jgi:hypothetical protein